MVDGKPYWLQGVLLNFGSKMHAYRLNILATKYLDRWLSAKREETFIVVLLVIRVFAPFSYKTRLTDSLKIDPYGSILLYPNE